MIAAAGGLFTGPADLTDAEWRSLFAAFANSALDAVVCVDSAGCVVEWNRAAVEIFGWTAEDAIGEPMGRLIVPAEMVDAHDAAMARYLATGEARIIGRRVEIDALDKAGTRFPVELAIAPLQLRGETYFVARIRDISRRRQRERQLEMVAKELDHRVKNAMAVMVSIAKLAARTADIEDVDDFVRVFCDRVDAYKMAHELLGASQYKGVELGDLFDIEIRAFRPGLEHVSIRGPAVFLPARAALTIGMSIHEMITNAVKYGALSSPHGDLAVSWHLDAGELVIDWIERGGPAIVTVPTHRGFGSQLIQIGLKADLHGSFHLAFPSSGLVGQVRIPTTSLQALDEQREKPSASLPSGDRVAYPDRAPQPA